MRERLRTLIAEQEWNYNICHAQLLIIIRSYYWENSPNRGDI